MKDISCKILLEQVRGLDYAYFTGSIPQETYNEEMTRLNEEAEDIDRREALSTRRILELELKLAEAYKDPLTGFFVRRVLENSSLSQKIPVNTTFIMCDIDDFKGINDKYGHEVGDEVLKIVGKKVREIITRSSDPVIRYDRDETEISSDPVIRYGGDEIAIILPVCPTEKAEEKCRDIRALVTRAIYNETNIEEPITLSFGIYQRTNEEVSVKSALALADSALYYTKEHNKGMDKSGISIYTPDMPVVRKKG